MILVLCECGEHLGDEMMQGLVEYILHFKSVDVNEEDDTSVSCCVFDCDKRHCLCSVYCAGSLPCVRLCWCLCAYVFAGVSVLFIYFLSLFSRWP